MKATANQISEQYGIDRRTVSKWLCASPPCPSALEKKVRVFDTVEVFEWFTARAVRKAINDRDRATPANVTEIRLRYDEARTKLTEIELAVREAKLVPLQTLKDDIAEVCNRLRAALINIPSNFGPQLEQCGMSATDAERLLIDLADSITADLRGTADDMEAEERS